MEKNPPPVSHKTYMPYRSGWQPIPAMGRSSSLPESNQQSGKVDFTKKPCHGDLQKTYQRTISLPTPRHSQFHQDSQDSVHSMKCCRSDEPWKKPESSGTVKADVKAFIQKTEKLRKAVHLYDYFLSEHGAQLQGQITDLEEVANSVDKVHKGVRIAGITGGVAGAAGVAAAVGGILLAPVTFGASLAVSAVGVGVAAAGGVTGASAAITNKVHANMDRKKVETILKDHSTMMPKIEESVKVICANIEFLKNYDLSTLKAVDRQAVKMAKMAQKVGNSVEVIGELSKSSGLVQGFAMGLDMYFNKEDSEKLKKGSEAKFAKQIRKVAKQMKATLDELMKFQTILECQLM